jgi:hypothetical protein
VRTACCWLLGWLCIWFLCFKGFSCRCSRCDTEFVHGQGVYRRGSVFWWHQVSFLIVELGPVIELVLLCCRCAQHQQTAPRKDEEFYFQHKVGQGILHLGKHRFASISSSLPGSSQVRFVLLPFTDTQRLTSHQAIGSTSFYGYANLMQSSVPGCALIFCIFSI